MSLDPIIANFLAASADLPPIHTMAPAEARTVMRERMAPLLAMAPAHDAEDFTVPARGHELTLRLLRPDSPGPHPVVLFIHGGGWVICDLDTHKPLASALARGADAAVVMVDYRLAPEHPFPAAIDDCTAALIWIVMHGAERGLDPGRIVVAGDSAGGNLAAVLARRARDAGGPDLAGQYLIYPVIDLPDPERYPSYIENDRDYGLSTEAMAWFWSQYAGRAMPGPDAIPMLVDDLTGLAPALVQTAEFDVLRDEGEAYAARMAQDGVSVLATRHPGMVHGFLAMVGMVPGADAAMAEGCDWLRARFA